MERAKLKQFWADLALLLVTLIWGSTFVMVKNAVSAYPVFPFLTIRFSFATVALVFFAFFRYIRQRRLTTPRPRVGGWQDAGAGILIGLFLFAGYALQTWGLRFTSASKAGFITGLSVVIVPVLSTTLLRRRPTTGSILGVCLATVGLALITLNDGLSVAAGDLFVLGCAFAFALHIVSVSAFAPKMDVLFLTIVQVATVAFASAVTSLFIGFGSTPTAALEPWPAPTPETWFAAAFTGLLATAVAFGLQTAMQRFTTPTHTAVIFTAEPVFAALFGVLLSDDVLTSQTLTGGVLIIAGMLVSEIPWSRRTAAIISRFLGPNYMAGPLLVIMGLSDPASWRQGLLWALGIGIPAMAGALFFFTRQLHKGKISDWEISNREERLQRGPIMISLITPLIPLIILRIFQGPKPLQIVFLCALVLVIFNLAITFAWKVSQHVSSLAASTTLVTAVLGIGAAPILLLIPLMAWARVKVGAHTVMQTIIGALLGALATLATLRLFGIL